MIPWWVGLLMFLMGVAHGFAIGVVRTPVRRRFRRVVGRVLDVPESVVNDRELLD